MTEEQMKIIEKKKQIVIVPSYDNLLVDSFNETLDNNVVVIGDELENEKILIDAINNSKVKNVIFVDYLNIYDKVIPNLKNKQIDAIFTHEIASLTNPYTRMMFNKILEFVDRKLFTKIYLVNKSTSEVLKKANMNVEFLKLKTKAKVSNKKEKTIGIISFDYNPNNNFYTMLTAVKMVDCDSVKFIGNMYATHQFVEFFDVNCTLCDNVDDVMKDNFVNLYCNFTDNNFPLILKSMNSKIPCIIGNCDIFDNYPILKENLVLKSDDDVNEIVQKINNIDKVYKDIFNEYEKFKKEYLSN